MRNSVICVSSNSSSTPSRLAEREKQGMDDEITFGPLARGIYIALMWLTVLLGAVAADTAWARAWLPWHILLLLFLGLGLKPLLRHTGLHHWWRSQMATLQAKRHADHHAEAAQKVERERRDEKLRKSRVRDPRLPKRW